MYPIPWEPPCNGEHSRLYLQNSTNAFGKDQKQRPTKYQPQALDSAFNQETAQLQGEVGPPVSRQYWTLLSGPGTSPAILSQGVGAGVSQASNDVCREVRCSWECDVLALFRPDWDDLVWFQFNPNALHKQCFFPKIAHCCLLPLLHVARRN